MDFNNFFYKSISYGVPIKSLFSGTVFDIFSGTIPDSSNLKINQDNVLLCRITYNGEPPVSRGQSFIIKFLETEDNYTISFNNLKFYGNLYNIKSDIIDILQKINRKFFTPLISENFYFLVEELSENELRISIQNVTYSPIIISCSDNIQIINYVGPSGILNFKNNDFYLECIENNFGICRSSGVATFFRIHLVEDDQLLDNFDLSVRAQGTIGNGVFYDVSMFPDLKAGEKVILHNLSINYF